MDINDRLIQLVEAGKNIALTQLGTDEAALVIAKASIIHENFGGDKYIRVAIFGKDHNAHTADVIVRFPSEWLDDKEAKDVALGIIEGARDYIAKNG